ncbi:hypothetical protein OIU77_021753 [Salix suchowensis]|uniref:Uncharacterized protein n=1 Tax=Salix suchowensis TaxID=1278906 RepID=A0ABQ9CE92_9ROSI|nr:hypothetical protein OIU77_021753 [Salix suchowensis]
MRLHEYITPMHECSFLSWLSLNKLVMMWIRSPRAHPIRPLVRGLVCCTGNMIMQCLEDLVYIPTLCP